MSKIGYEIVNLLSSSMDENIGQLCRMHSLVFIIKSVFIVRCGDALC